MKAKKTVKKTKYKGRIKGAVNRIQTDKGPVRFYCSAIVWAEAKKKHGRKLSQFIEDFLRC